MKKTIDAVRHFFRSEDEIFRDPSNPFRKDIETLEEVIKEMSKGIPERVPLDQAIVLFREIQTAEQLQFYLFLKEKKWVYDRHWSRFSTRIMVGFFLLGLAVFYVTFILTEQSIAP